VVEEEEEGRGRSSTQLSRSSKCHSTNSKLSFGWISVLVLLVVVSTSPNIVGPALPRQGYCV
jgi:hypothetical protein